MAKGEGSCRMQNSQQRIPTKIEQRSAQRKQLKARLLEERSHNEAFTMLDDSS